MLDMINITEILLCKYRDCCHYLSLYDNFLKIHPGSLEEPLRYRVQIRDFVESITYNNPERIRRVLTPDVIKNIEEYLSSNLQKLELGLM